MLLHTRSCATAFSRRLSCADAEEIPGGALPDYRIAVAIGLRQRGTAVGCEAADEGAGTGVEQVQVAFAVDNADIGADARRTAGKACGELILLPDRCAGRLVERLHAA